MGNNSLSRLPRRWLLSGAAAGLVVVGGGALAIANRQPADQQAEVSQATQPAPPPPSTATPSVAPATGSTTVAQEGPPPQVVTSLPQSAEDRLNAAREAGKDDIKPQHPVMQAQGVGLDVKTTEHGDVRKDGKMLRVVSAHGNLTGYSELAWVAGAGQPYGDAACSQNFQLSNEKVAEVRPTLMVCWRISDKRSAYTVSVDIKGHPSKREAVAAIDKAWAALG